MQIGYSDSTLLLGIIRQAQEIVSEARWLEYYGHSVNPPNIEFAEDCVHNIEDCLKVIKENLDNLKGENL